MAHDASAPRLHIQIILTIFKVIYTEPNVKYNVTPSIIEDIVT